MVLMWTFVQRVGQVARGSTRSLKVIAVVKRTKRCVTNRNLRKKSSPPNTNQNRTQTRFQATLGEQLPCFDPVEASAHKIGRRLGVIVLSCPDHPNGRPHMQTLSNPATGAGTHFEVFWIAEWMSAE